MATKIKYSVQLPDGRIATRKSARTYTHAIAVYCVGSGQTEPSWGLLGYCGSPELAQKRLAKDRATAAKVGIWEIDGEPMRILPVEVS